MPSRLYTPFVFMMTVAFLLGVRSLSSPKSKVQAGDFSHFTYLAAVLNGEPPQPSPTATPDPTPTAEPTAEPTPTTTPVGGACNPSGGSGGRAAGVHNVSVAGVQTLLVVGEGYTPQKPTQLAFYLHGDGAHELSIFQDGSNPVNQLVNQEGWVFIVPIAPNETKRWNSPGNVDALTGVMAEMFARYNLCRNALLGSSASGGSVFWSARFFPATGGLYPTLMILHCGAAPGPESRLRELAQLPGVTASSQLNHTYGSQDFLIEPIGYSIEVYRETGFDVLVDELPGIGHCEYDVEAKTRVYWESVRDRLDN